MTQVDVAVIGAGPAGAIAATLLARLGRTVALYDPDSREGERIGESLPAIAADLLERHSLPGPLSDQRHAPIKGTISNWGGVRTEDDALTRPGAPDWRLDRAVFDTELRGAAAVAGVAHLASLAKNIERRPSGWVVEGDCGSTLSASWLIDATGRRAAVARRYGGGRNRQVSQVAIWAVGDRHTGSCTAKTLVETQGAGWWYGAVLPSGRPVAAYHCSDACAMTIRRQPDTWHRYLSQTAILSCRLPPGAFKAAELHYTDATGIATTTPAGDTWLACGDAALAFDPIASQGLLNAVQSGIIAADVVSGARTAADYCKRMQAVWDDYVIRHKIVRARAALQM